MAGLLDFLTTQDPAKQQGLLAAASALLQAGGPSRIPISTGQGLGAALGAYQQGVQGYEDRAVQLEQANQLAKLRNFAIQDKESDLKAQEAQRKRAAELLSLTSNYWKGGGQASPMPGGQSAQEMMQSLASGRGATSIPQDAQVPPGAASMSGPGLDRGAMTNQRLAYAQFLRQNGYGAEAQAEEDSALKLQPKVKEWQKVTVGNKVLYAPYFEDGSNGQPVPLEVAEKLVAVNRGGSTDLTNAYTGATVRSLTNSASPEALLAAGTAARRLAFDQQQAGRPVFNAEAGGFVLPPSAANPGGKLLPVAGVGGKAPTEFQGKSAAFGLRATEADKILRDLAAKGPTGAFDLVASDRPGTIKSIAQSVPLIGGGIGSFVNTLPGVIGGPNANQQKAEQARRDFVNAVLRQESGAAIAESEFDNASKQYFPQPGDDPDVIAQKARNRQLAIQGLQMNAGKAWMTAPAASGGWSITKVQ